MSGDAEPDLAAFYDSLWREGEAAFARGVVTIDPHLADLAGDLRRGVTVILRPGEAVRREMETLAAELRELEPQQYLYTPGELHVTVLSLLTCAADYQPTHLDEYKATVAEAVRGLGRFAIRFEGVTATADAVMIQGFPDDALARLRSRLGEQLAARGLPHRQRYVPRAAHVTVMRFGQTPVNVRALAEKIRVSRNRAFGTTVVTTLELVENDWYMSATKTRTVAEFDLA